MYYVKFIPKIRNIISGEIFQKKCFQDKEQQINIYACRGFAQSVITLPRCRVDSLVLT